MKYYVITDSDIVEYEDEAAAKDYIELNRDSSEIMRVIRGVELDVKVDIMFSERGR